MNQFKPYFIYIWKYHKKTPCVAILKKKNQKYHFFFFYKIGEQEQNRSCRGGGRVQVGGEGCGKSTWEGEYSANTMYTCM
jgi:hypothetical protein